MPGSDQLESPAPAPEAFLELIEKDTVPVRPSTLRPSPVTDTRYGSAALKSECEHVATTGEGQRNDQLNRAAYAAGQLYAGGELSDPSLIEERLTNAALASGLSQSEIPKTIRSGFEAGIRDPRSAPQQSSPSIESDGTAGSNGPRVKPPESDARRTETAHEQTRGNSENQSDPSVEAAADPKRFWQGSSYRPALLADEMMAIDRYVSSPIADDGVGAFLHAYRDGVFGRAEELASKNAEALLAVRASNARIDDAVKLIRRRVAVPHDDLNPRGQDLINVQNGMLDWRAGELLPHDPGYLSTIRIPVRFDQEATSEIIPRVLKDWFPADALELAGEMLGYLLVPSRKHQVAFMLVGEGENGKSTFINLIRSLLGRTNVSTETLHDLEENRFRAASLFGKLANLCADIDDRSLRFTGMFKKITGDDSVAAERKHQHPFDFEPFARLLFSANTPPAPRGDRNARVLSSMGACAV
jgi:Family of unknown function (DUF5906)/D5 N terminal like